MSDRLLQELTATVQRNCHIIDAEHATGYGLCTYLMKMREYYRWEMGQGFTEALPKEAVGDWLTEREGLWEALAEAEFAPLRIGDREYDPFDSEPINEALRPHGLVYSGGLGGGCQPHFFLGRLEREEHEQGHRLLVVGREYARDLAAPPAMSQGSVIYLRRESLRRLLWERLENWRWSRADNALGRAFSSYDFDADLESALDAMAEVEVETVLQHERGEVLVAAQVGEDWGRMLQVIAGTPAELMVRAVRDHWADCLTTLPMLAERNHAPSIHFYVGNLGGMRKELFPGLFRAYKLWWAGGSTGPLRTLAQSGAGHWAVLGREVLEAFRRGDEWSAARLAEVIRGRPL